MVPSTIASFGISEDICRLTPAKRDGPGWRTLQRRAPLSVHPQNLSAKAKESPRKDFIYVNDDGQIVAMRYDAWKAVFLENRGEAFGVWREPFIELRVPLLFNLRRDPFERAQHNANTYHAWFLDRVYVLVPMQQLAGKFLMTMKDYPPSQTPGSFNLEKIQKQIESAIGTGK